MNQNTLINLANNQTNMLQFQNAIEAIQHSHKRARVAIIMDKIDEHSASDTLQEIENKIPKTKKNTIRIHNLTDCPIGSLTFKQITNENDIHYIYKQLFIITKTPSKKAVQILIMENEKNNH